MKWQIFFITLYIYLSSARVASALLRLEDDDIIIVNDFQKEKEVSNVLSKDQSKIETGQEQYVPTGPIIGILTQPYPKLSYLRDGIPGFHEKGNSEMLRGEGSKDNEYIAASYVKWVESAGARVVPIRYTWPKEKILEIVDQLNGLLLPGGGASLDPSTSKYYEAGKYIWDHIIETKGKGKEKFPIWGTCQGFEQISVLAAGSNYTVLTGSKAFAGEDQPLPVQGLGSSLSLRWKSRIFRSIPSELLVRIQKFDSTYNSHEMGVTPELWKENHHLQEIFGDPIAIGHDKNGKAYVSIIESKPETGLSIFGVQFHPEKPLYEWAPTPKFHIPHNDAALDFGLYLARFFVKEAEKTMKERSFKGGAEAESKALIEGGGIDGAGKRVYLGSNNYFMEIFEWSS